MRTRILVIADTHKKLKPLEAVLSREINSVSAVIHLGDGNRDMDAFSPMMEGVPLLMVRGNNDAVSDGVPACRTIQFAGKRIFAVHGHNKYNVKEGLSKLKKFARLERADIALYGHIHMPAEEYDDGLYLFDPGAVKKGNYAVLEITENGDVLWHPKEIERNLSAMNNS